MSPIDRRAELIPAEILPLFDDAFVRSCGLIDAFVRELARGVLRETGVLAVMREGAESAAEIAGRLGFPESRVPALESLLKFAGPGGASPAPTGLLEGETGPDADAIEAEQAAVEPAALPSYRLVRHVAENYPRFLAGAVEGVEVLFAPDRIALWAEYFAGDHTLYAVNNSVGAAAATRWLPPGPVRALELGGGLASGAVALVDALTAAGRTIEQYRFTELAPWFLKRGRRTLSARWPDAPWLAGGLLDIDRPFAEQGIEAGSTTLVYAVNTLHVAADLAFTLGEIRRALAPGGWLVVAECVRPREGQPLYPEFVFNLLASFSAPAVTAAYRPHGGFLTPEQWSAAFEAGGFETPRVYPDLAPLQQEYPDFITGALGAPRRA